MVRWICLGLLALWAGVAGPARAVDDGLRAPFDPAALSAPERRLIQTALAEAGDFAGPIDGDWDRASQDGFAAWSAREFAAPPTNLQAAALMIGFVDAIARRGWTLVYLPGLDLSLALPLALVERADRDGNDGGGEDGAGDPVWRSRTGSLSVIAAHQTEAEAADWHRAVLAMQAQQGVATVRREAGRMITASSTANGWRIYQRSERVGDGWSTLRLLAGPDQAALIGLAGASIARGEPERWDLPQDGALSRLVGAAFAALGGAAAQAPAATLVAAPQPAEAADADEVSTGTAFYVAPRLLLTAAHVVEGCATAALADGTRLQIVAVDRDRDIAALRAPGAGATWLGLAAPQGLRLGQRVSAVGYPYFGLSGTRLNVAGGNVSALAGMDDDARYLSITAPVQPGNSGGPLFDAHGAVAGLVVARLSETYIEQTTGSLPQNVNYALGSAEIAAFLREAGLRPAAHPLPAFDMDEGAPSAITQAVVPLVCY